MLSFIISCLVIGLIWHFILSNDAKWIFCVHYENLIEQLVDFILEVIVLALVFGAAPLAIYKIIQMFI